MLLAIIPYKTFQTSHTTLYNGQEDSTPEVRGSNLGILSEQVDECSPKPAQVPPS
jgi:hypothetical protein